MPDLADLKKKHRTVFCSQVADFTVFFRPLTLRERDAWMKIISTGLVPLGKAYDQVFREVVLDEALIQDMNQTPAGLVPTVVEVVFMISGNDLRTQDDMDRMNKDIKEVREAVSGNIFEQFMMLICQAFPSLTPKDVEDMEYPQILRLTMMAESMLGLEEPVVP